MSILTGFVTAKEGVLAVDTLASAPVDRTMRYSCTSKSHVVTLFGAIFATRGGMPFPTALLTCINRLSLASFDAFLPHFPEAVRQAYEIAAPINDQHGLTHHTQAIVMGWSKARKRVVALTAKNYEGTADPYVDRQGYSPGFHFLEVPDGGFMMPSVGPLEMARLKERLARQTMQEFVVSAAKAQREWIDRTMAPGFIGGRLIVTTVNKFGIGLRQVDAWPDDAEFYRLVEELEGPAPAAVQ